ncbi:MAG: ketopantoate reductase family protein [Lautropia sp.]
MKRFLIVGAGAIGGFLAGRLAQAGSDVHVVTRGPHREALARAGLHLIGSDGSEARVPLATHADIDAAAAAAGTPFDVVLVCLKAHQLLPVAPALGRVARHAQLLVPVHNGVGWWYFQKSAGRFAGEPIRAVDPDGRLIAELPVDRTVPMFAFKSAQVTEPGVVRYLAAPSDRFPLGELDGHRTERVAALIAAFTAAGLASAETDVRATMWSKLLGNIYANPISALTGVAIGRLAAFPPTRALSVELMRECSAVAQALGVVVPMSIDERLARAAEVPLARPSMLQDREAGRPMEVEPILGALAELGAKTGIPTPHVAALLACLRLIQEETA